MPAALPPPPDAEGWADGLAWALFTPPGPAGGGVVILHGAGSAKEHHFDFAARCRTAGLAALAFDARGHGASAGPLDGRLVADVATMAGVLRREAGVTGVGLRGSSMGGWLALVAARDAAAGAVVAICPASTAGLRAGLAERRFSFTAGPGADAALAAHDELAAAAVLACPLLLQHAASDDVVPVAHSHAVHEAAPGSRLVVVPGGDHGSVQHDPAHQDAAIAFLAEALSPSAAAAR